MRNEIFSFIAVSCLVGCGLSVESSNNQDVTKIIEVTKIIPIQDTQQNKILFPEECLKRQSGVNYSIYDWIYPTTTIGGCSFIVPSTDGNLIAYSTMNCNNQSDCKEEVRLLGRTISNRKTIFVMNSGYKSWVGSISWSAQNDLVIEQTGTNGGIRIFVYNGPDRPDNDEGIEIEGGLREWNNIKSAFTTLGWGGYESCSSRFSGYDFVSHKIFPEIAEILNLLPNELRIRPAKYGIRNGSSWIDDTTLLLELTPLKYDNIMDDYELLPTIIGKIVLTIEGPEYSTIASSSNEDYYFDIGDESHQIKSKPHIQEYCKQTLP